MSHNYSGFVFDITAGSMHLSLVYLVAVSVTIFLFIFFLTQPTIAFCENTIHLMIRKRNYFNRQILQEKICHRKSEFVTRLKTQRL